MSHQQSARRLNERQLREIEQILQHVTRSARTPRQALRVADISRSLNIDRHRVTRFIKGLLRSREVCRLQLSGTFRYYAAPPKGKPRLAKMPDPRLQGFTRVAPGKWRCGNYEIWRKYPGRHFMVDHSKKYSFSPAIPSLRVCAQLIKDAEQNDIEHE